MAIVPVPHLDPRFSLRDRETRGPMLDTQAETFGRVYLTDRELADFTAEVAKAEKASPADWRRWRAVLEAAGWQHPDVAAELAATFDERAAELAGRVERAEAERDALARTIQLVPQPQRERELAAAGQPKTSPRKQTTKETS